MSIMTPRLRVAFCSASLLLAACASRDTPGNAQAERTGAQGVAASTAIASCEPEILHEEFAALPTWIAVNDESVFWVEGRTDSLLQLAKGSIEPSILVTDVSRGLSSFVAEADAVYWGGRDGMVHRIAVDGSADVVLAETGGERASALRLQGGYIYWLASSGNVSDERVAVDVRRVRADGSAGPERLWSSNRASSGLAVQTDYLFVDEYTWPSRSAAPDANGVITRIDPSEGSSVALVTDLLFPMVHAADDEYVYYSAQTHDAERLNQLWRVRAAGGVPQLVFNGAPTGVDIGQLVLDSGVAWWGQGDGGRGLLRRTAPSPADAVVVATLADTQHMPGVAVDADALYFSSSFSGDDLGPGAIWRVGRHCPTD